jgi:hypothetical protein
MLSSSRKNRIKEALKRIKERQAALLSSSVSKYREPGPGAKDESGTKSTPE